MSAIPDDPFRDHKGLVVETIGGLRLRVEGTDVTASFLAQRLSAYLWIYLLSRRVSGQATPIKRTALAAEVAVDRPHRERLARLRRILHDLPHRLPAGVAACVRIAGESVDATARNSRYERLFTVT